MNQRRYLLVLLFAVLLGGLGAWLALGPDGGLGPRNTRDNASDRARANISPGDAAEDATSDPTAASKASGTSTETSATDPEIVRPDTPQRPAKPGTPANLGNPSGTTPGGTPGKAPDPPRPLTAREQAELQRKTQGRADHNSRVTRAPENGTTSIKALAKSLKPEEWQKQFAEEGLEPPEMVSTQISGKVMSPLSNEGIAGAHVVLISFLPWAGKLGGSLYTVATELTANQSGEFTGYIPAPPKPPQFHPPVGMLVEAPGEVAGDFKAYQIVAGLPIETLRPGEFNQLGIFWAPEEPFDIKCDASQFTETGLKVVSTGELDPQRWHPNKRAQALALFSATPVKPKVDGTPDAMAGMCTLRGTWDTRDAPFLTLIHGDKSLITRRCVRKKTNTSESGGTQPEVPQPFEDMLFENSGYTSITGQCVDADGGAVAGAIVHTAGDATPVSTTSDASGWFEIANPGKNTKLLVGTHDDFINTMAWNVKPGDTGVQVKFHDRKPVLWFRLRDRYTQVAITQVSLKVIEKSVPPEGGGKAPQPRTQTFELNSATGEFVQKAEWLVAAIVLEKVGYFPRTLNDPISLQAAAGGMIDIELYPGRELNVKPRQFTAVQDTTRWFPDAKPEDPGIYTAWSNHWIEWAVDFGDAPEQGLEGGSFDILLGCTNQGLVDNQYKFEVEVWVDGSKKGTLSIIANSTAIQTGRMKLGKLSGNHTIRLVWLNDKWIPDQLDANIRYASLQFLEQP